MIIYQLCAYGTSKYLEGKKFISSKKVFYNSVDAQNYIPEFKKICCNSEDNKISSLCDLDENDIEIKINELDLN